MRRADLNLARLRLYCLPYSGASAAVVYGRWSRMLPQWIEVRPLELPGRGGRIHEPPETDWTSLLDRLTLELDLHDDAPFAFFGHSLGALIAFELAHRVRAGYGLEPQIVFASGTSAPSRRNDERYREPLSDTALVAELRRLNGTAPDVLADPELLSLLLPTLRADFFLCGQYQYRVRRPLTCTLHVFGGVSDIGSGAIDEWRQETSGRFGIDLLDGDHFFIHSRAQELTKLVALRGGFVPLASGSPLQ